MKAFQTLRARIGLPKTRLHDLRHAHVDGTQLLAANVPLRTVIGRLGHADAAVTLNVYAHWLKDSDQDDAKVIGGATGGATGGRRRRLTEISGRKATSSTD